MDQSVVCKVHRHSTWVGSLILGIAAITDMQKWPLRAVGFNPLSASCQDRLLAIGSEFEQFDFILLAGTGIHINEQEQQQVDRIEWLHSGWGKGSMSNRSCGVSIIKGG